MDEVIVLILVLFLIAALICGIVLPIVAFIISLSSRRRIAELEARANRLEQLLTARPIFPTAAETKQESPPQPAVPPPAFVLGPLPKPVTSRTPLNAYQLESMIGRRWVGLVAILLILFATAFFLKYAFDNRWIGELARVTIGIAFGAGMCLAGFRYHRKRWRTFSQILTAGGIVLLYLSTYAAFGYYHLVGQKTAFFVLAILIAEAAALSLIYDAPAIAIMALIGGLLTPVLLHSERDQ